MSGDGLVRPVDDSAHDMLEPPAPRGTILDDLRADLGRSVETPEKSLPVPRRPGVWMVYKPEIDYDMLRKWTARCTDRKTKRVDQMRLAALVLTATQVGLEMVRGGKSGDPFAADSNREEAFGPDGDRLTFGSRALQDMLNTMEGAPGAIKNLFGVDGNILLAMNRVLEDAGYSEYDLESDDADPFGG